MPNPPNAYTNFIAVEAVIADEDLFEVRADNLSNGQIQYVGKSITPNADTSLPIWYIKKIQYDGNGFLNYIQLPVNGIGFLYVWDDRASYF